MIIIKTIIYTVFFPVILFLAQRYNGLNVFLGTVLKFLFYADILMTVGGWYESMLIAKRLEYDERDIAKIQLFTVLFITLTEIHNIIGGL